MEDSTGAPGRGTSVTRWTPLDLQVIWHPPPGRHSEGSVAPDCMWLFGQRFSMVVGDCAPGPRVWADAKGLHVGATSVEDAWISARPFMTCIVASRSNQLCVRGSIQRSRRGCILLLKGMPVGAANQDAATECEPDQYCVIDPHSRPSTTSYAVGGSHGRFESQALAGIAVVVEDSNAGVRYVSPKRGHLLLASRSYLNEAGSFWGLNCGEAMDRFFSMREQENALLTTLLASVPMISCSEGTEISPDVLDRRSAKFSYSETQLRNLAGMQAVADGVYGRLELEPALVWTLEELGELAQALRRGEGSDRVGEELGQLFNWVLCLANITRVDLAQVARAALNHEVLRQLEKYGELRPYLKPGT